MTIALCSQHLIPLPLQIHQSHKSPQQPAQSAQQAVHLNWSHFKPEF